MFTFFAVLGLGFGSLALRGLFRRSQQRTAALAAGLSPAEDLTHVPAALQRTALWTLSDGGFERCVVRGVVSRNAHDLEVTAFELETLRERRGEWAYLPVDRPFRIGGVLSVVVCVVDRAFPHLLLKRGGRGDELASDTALDRVGHVAKAVRVGFGVPQSYPAELPRTLAVAALPSALPEGWRAYGDPTALTELVAAGLAPALAQAGRRDLVVELLDNLIVVYPAAREVVGADAFADLTATALAITDGVLASSRPVSPRGIEPLRDPAP